LGVQCPDNNSTGQFVYPPDCKFFVNCWKGRAFVQPCAPGTHFNPDTLECDFPHKVKCYEDESVYFRESDSEFQINRKLQKLQVCVFFTSLDSMIKKKSSISNGLDLDMYYKGP